MDLPIFAPGQTIVAEEQWRELLWGAYPHRVVDSRADLLITHTTVGAVSVIATNRLLPASQGLTRSDRKLLARQTCEAQAAEFAESLVKLSFFRPRRWSRINVGWEPATGKFLGWYVNFERPPTATAAGVSTKDLVLDLWVDAARTWRWKDDDDFDTAIDAGVIDAELREVLADEAERVLRELADGTGPFDPRWPDFRADAEWPVPVLPADVRWNGAR